MTKLNLFRKLTAFSICILLIVSAVPLTANAIVYEEKDEIRNFQWTLDTSTGLLDVSVIDDTKTASLLSITSYYDLPWLGYESFIKKAVFHEGITSLPRYAFYKFRELNDITLPRSLKKEKSRIYYYAFYEMGGNTYNTDMGMYTFNTITINGIGTFKSIDEIMVNPEAFNYFDESIGWQCLSGYYRFADDASPWAISAVNKKVDSITDECVTELGTNADSYQYYLWIHDYICSHNDYDYNMLAEKKENITGFAYTSYDISAYGEFGALLTGHSVCNGITIAGNRLVSALNKKVKVVLSSQFCGNSIDMNHAWSIINQPEFEDEKYYSDTSDGIYGNFFMDMTWDDSLKYDSKGMVQGHFYFSKSEDDFPGHVCARGNLTSVPVGSGSGTVIGNTYVCNNNALDNSWVSSSFNNSSSRMWYLDGSYYFLYATNSSHSLYKFPYSLKNVIIGDSQFITSPTSVTADILQLLYNNKAYDTSWTTASGSVANYYMQPSTELYRIPSGKYFLAMSTPSYVEFVSLDGELERKYSVDVKNYGEIYGLDLHDDTLIMYQRDGYNTRTINKITTLDLTTYLTECSAGHKFVQTAYVMPTCIKDGYIEQTCSVCGKVQRTAIDKVGHDFYISSTAATCTVDGKITQTCKVCGVVKNTTIPATGHCYDSGKITKEPTPAESGIREYTCTKCGAKYETEIKYYTCGNDVLDEYMTDNDLWDFVGYVAYHTDDNGKTVFTEENQIIINAARDVSTTATNYYESAETYKTRTPFMWQFLSTEDIMKMYNGDKSFNQYTASYGFSTYENALNNVRNSAETISTSLTMSSAKRSLGYLDGYAEDVSIKTGANINYIAIDLHYNYELSGASVIEHYMAGNNSGYKVYMRVADSIEETYYPCDGINYGSNTTAAFGKIIGNLYSATEIENNPSVDGWTYMGYAQNSEASGYKQLTSNIAQRGSAVEFLIINSDSTGATESSFSTLKNFSTNDIRLFGTKTADTLKGDVNEDGYVNVLDAVLLSRYVAEWDGVNIHLYAGDLNCDENVTLVDSIYLRRYLASWKGYPLPR